MNNLTIEYFDADGNLDMYSHRWYAQFTTQCLCKDCRSNKTQSEPTIVLELIPLSEIVWYDMTEESNVVIADVVPEGLEVVTYGESHFDAYGMVDSEGLVTVSQFQDELTGRKVSGLVYSRLWSAANEFAIPGRLN